MALAAALALHIGGCSQELRSIPKETILDDGSPIVLPTSDCHGLFLADAVINGCGPFTLVIDTGSAATVVTPRVASMLSGDARPVMFMSGQGAGGGEAPVRSIVAVKSMKCGALELRGFEAATIDLGAIQRSMGTRIDGIIGYPAFANVLLTLDYPGRRAVVARGELPSPDQREVLACTTFSMPRIEIRVGDDPQTALLDSGFGGTVDLAGFSYAPLTAPPVGVGTPAVVGGKASNRIARLGVDVAFGRFVLARPIVSEARTESLIGAQALRDFAITFDQAHQRVRFHTDGPGAVAFPSVRGAGLVVELREGRWIVSSVTAGGQAEIAGIRAGDVVTACNGTPMPASGCEPACGGATDAPRTTLRVRRDGVESEIPLERPVLVP
jgi:hypothetical protein